MSLFWLSPRLALWQLEDVSCHRPSSSLYLLESHAAVGSVFPVSIKMTRWLHNSSLLFLPLLSAHTFSCARSVQCFSTVYTEGFGFFFYMCILLHNFSPVKLKRWSATDTNIWVCFTTLLKSSGDVRVLVGKHCPLEAKSCRNGILRQRHQTENAHDNA